MSVSSGSILKLQQFESRFLLCVVTGFHIVTDNLALSVDFVIVVAMNRPQKICTLKVG